MSSSNAHIYLEALAFHSAGQKGKIAMEPTKPLNDQKDLALAYSPGVAAPCLEIQKDPETAYEYTAKGNFIAVISNGTAVLGLGNLGALASKPVMEGKAVLFKRFADIDAIDIEVDTTDIDEFIQTVKCIGNTWGGINLEDIKAPECFVIEQRLKELLNIPVFHDDQHGTAIVVAAGMINACYLTNKDFHTIKVVVNGAGAAAIACIELLQAMGVQPQNTILCDTKGVIYKGRTDGMNQWKEKHALDTPKRSLAEAVAGSDVFLGLSVKGAMTKDMVKSMNIKPIIFAMANPDPEIIPADVMEVRNDAIIATGRSDYNNQVNNLMCFPYIFRGALDVHAKSINIEMKMAAAQAIANLARKDITEEVISASNNKIDKFGPDYIVPITFDSRLIEEVSLAVAKAAMESGVAKKPILDFQEYRIKLAGRLNPVVNTTSSFFAKLKYEPKKVVFASGEEPAMIKAAVQWCDQGYGEAILVGNEQKIRQIYNNLGEIPSDRCSILDPVTNTQERYADYMYHKMQRKGMTRQDCFEDIKNSNTLFASAILANNEADAVVCGLSQGYIKTLKDVIKVIDVRATKVMFALSMLVKNDKVLFLADTAINENPDAEILAKIACQAAQEVRYLGREPRVAFISFSTFGAPERQATEKIREAVKILDGMQVDFEYDGEMAANVAINANALKLYPFCRLSDVANILIMPALHSAHISSKLLEEFGGATLIGPILCGLSKRVQIVKMGAVASDVLYSAAISATLKE